MTPNQSHIAGLELALQQWNNGGPAAHFAAQLRGLIDQAKSTPDPVQDEAVEVVAWMKHELCTRLYFHAPPEPSIPLMIVAQHSRIMAAATLPDVQVPVTGSLDEIDAPVWPFINEEARKVGAEKGRIETYQYARANGGVVVLWDGPRVHAMAVTIRDDLNRTRCVRMLAAQPLSPDHVEHVRALVDVLGRCQEHLHPHRDAVLWGDVCDALSSLRVKP